MSPMTRASAEGATGNVSSHPGGMGIPFGIDIAGTATDAAASTHPEVMNEAARAAATSALISGHAPNSQADNQRPGNDRTQRGTQS